MTRGLILQALVLQIGDSVTDSAVALAEKLLNGVRPHLVEKGLLMAWKGNSPSGYENDYQTGIAVFWRSVLQVWELNKMHGSLKLYKPLLQTSADAATNPQQDWIELANDLAVLVAAYVLLPQM